LDLKFAIAFQKQSQKIQKLFKQLLFRH